MKKGNTGDNSMFEGLECEAAKVDENEAFDNILQNLDSI